MGKPVFFLLLLCFIVSCGREEERPAIEKVVSEQPIKETEKTESPPPIIREPDDSTKYKKLRCGLYADKQGNIYLRRFDVCSTCEDNDTLYPYYVDQMPGDTILLKNVIDTATFQIFPNSQYDKDKNHAYYTDMHCTSYMWVIEEADAGSFEVFNFNWARDKNFVFYQARILPGCNPKTVKLVFGQRKDWLQYVTDGNTVYYGELPVVGADPATFWVSEDGETAFDKNGKWFGEEKVD